MYDVILQVSTSVLNEQTINPQMTSCNANERVADIMLTGGQPIQDWATSNAAINVPADFVGLKLRLPSVPDWISVWSSLGATPVTVPLTGIYAALQNGTADASEGDLTQIRSLNLHEVQSHLSLTSHLVGFAS